jgi:hypothetical protein
MGRTVLPAVKYCTGCPAKQILATPATTVPAVYCIIKCIKTPRLTENMQGRHGPALPVQHDSPLVSPVRGRGEAASS